MAATATTPVTTATTRSTASRYHRWIAGICLILGPIAQLYRTVPRNNQTGAEMLAWISNNTGDFLVHSLSYQMLGVMLFIPIYLALAHLLRERSPKLGLIGSIFGIISMIAFYGMGVMNLAFYGMSASGLDQGLMAQLIDSLGTSPIFLVVVPPYLLGMLIAVACLFTGLWRSRVVPRAALLLAILAILLDFFMPNVVGFIELAKVPQILAYGWIGLRILKMTDAEWEHPPVVA